MRSVACNRGFTLLEVLVSLAILSLSYVTVLNIIGSSASKAELAADYRAAMMIAESRLAESAAMVANSLSTRSGQVDGRFQWQTWVSPADDYAMSGYASQFAPVTISVSVTWDAGGHSPREVLLSTIRLTTGRAR